MSVLRSIYETLKNPTSCEKSGFYLCEKSWQNLVKYYQYWYQNYSTAPVNTLPTMYDLPSEDRSEMGLPDEFHDMPI